MKLSETIERRLQSEFPDLFPLEQVSALSGGYLNHLWRAEGKEFSMVLKYYPPHIASMPGVALDQSRMNFEASALRLLSRGKLSQLCNDRVSSPYLALVEPKEHLVVMEDIGNHPHLGEWLWQIQDESDILTKATDLGYFLAQLHNKSAQLEELKNSHFNLPVQQTRYELQYQLQDILPKTALSVQTQAQCYKKIKSLGELFLEPGVCLVMGDLWPNSVMVKPEGLRLIDWEFSHFGYPAQDVGHLSAHLWMRYHRAPLESLAQQVKLFFDRFLNTYLSEASPELLTPQERKRLPLHFGTEILIRTLGAFQSGYLYEGLRPTNPILQEAVSFATDYIVTETDLFKLAS